MRLYQYECKKLCKGKLCILLFVLLIGLNFLLGALTCQQEAREDLYAERFAKETENIIYNAKMNYLSIEEKQSENARYQLEVIKRYTAIQSLDVTQEIRGYDALLATPIPFVSALLLGILAAVILTYREHSASLILSSFGRSRVKICISKILVLFTVSFTGMLALLGSYTAGVAFAGGFSFSGATAPVQCIPAYIHCPYGITVIQAIFLRFLFAFLTVLILSLAVFLFGIVMRKAIWPFLLTVLLFGADDLLTRIHAEDIFSVFYQLNIRKFLSDGWLYRYSGKKLFGFCSSPALFGMVAGLAIALLMVLSVWRFRCGKVVRSVKSRRGSSARRKPTGRNFLSYEGKKIWSFKGIAAIGLLLFADLVMLNATVRPENRDHEKIYRYDIRQMSELTYDEQVSFAFEKRIQLNQTISEAQVIRQKYIDGEETREVYVEAQQRAGAAELELDVLRVIEQQLQSIGALNEQGVPARLIDSSGWKKLIQNQNPYFLLFAILLLTVPYIAFEKESGFHAVLPGIFRKNRSGYRRLRCAKFAVAVASSMLIVLLFSIGEFLLIHFRYGLGDWNAYAAGGDILFHPVS